MPCTKYTNTIAETSGVRGTPASEMPASPSPLSALAVGSAASLLSTSTSSDPRSRGAARGRDVFPGGRRRGNLAVRCETTWMAERRGRAGDGNVVARLPSELMRALAGVTATLPTTDDIPIRRATPPARANCGKGRHRGAFSRETKPDRLSC